MKRHKHPHPTPTEQKTFDWESVPRMPQVRTTDGHVLDWNRRAIVSQLIKETKLSKQFYRIDPVSEEYAEEIAAEVEKRIKRIGVKSLSGPLVRELTNVALLERGHPEWRNIATRVGTPVYDAHQIDVGNGFEAKENANLQDNAETAHKKKADKISKEQYLLLLPPKLADAHLNGDIHIHDLEYFGTRSFCMDWDLRYFFYYGLMPDGSGTKSSVAGPAKKPEVAILHAVKALGSAQTNFSVSGDEDVLIRGGSDGACATACLIKIGKFVDGLMSGKRTFPIQSIDGEFLDITDLDIKAAAFNPDTLKIEYKTINRIIRHPARDMMYRIRTQSGRMVSVTGAHSLFILDGGVIKPVLASEIENGDYVVIPKRLPAEAVDDDLDLIRSLIKLPDELISDIFVIGASDRINPIHELKYDWKRRDRVPLLFIKQNQIDIDADSTRLGMSRSPHTIPSTIKRSTLPMLSRLLGYFAAEGHITFDIERHVYSVVLSFGSHEIDIIEDAKSCIREVFGMDASIQQPHPTAVQLVISSKLAAIIFRDVLGTGTNSASKRIPPIIFNTTAENKLEFLTGYYCDGSVHRREISYKTVTEKLASDLLYLLLQAGIVGRQKCGEGVEHAIGDRTIKASVFYRTTISGRDNIKHLLQALPLSMDDFEYSSTVLTTTNPPVAVPINHAGILKIVESTDPVRNIPELTNIHEKKHLAPHRVRKLLEHIKLTAELSKSDEKRIEQIETIADGDLGFDIVESIQPIQPTTEYVYDLSIDGYENFIGGHGAVVLHNSGGQGFYNFLTFLAPYLEGLSYEEINQLMQMFVYEMTQMMVARGGQLVFSSVQLAPGVPKLWRDKPVVYKGKIWSGDQAPLRTYGEFEREVRLSFKALMDVMLEGDYWGKPFNFPKPEISIEPDFMEEDEEFNAKHPDFPTYTGLYDLAFELAAKFGAPYFDNQLPEYRGAGEGISCYQCLSKDELIPVIEDGNVKVDHISNFFESGAIDGIHTDGGVEFVQLDASAPGMEFGRFSVDAHAFNGVMRKKYRGKLLNIILESGRRIKVTLDHPLFVYRSGGFEKTIAGELVAGDYLPVMKHAGFGSMPVHSIDLEDVLIAGGYGGEITVKDDMVNILHAKRDGLPKTLRITPEFVRFLGYYLSEGCSDHSGRRYSVRLSFGKHETNLIDDAKRCIKMSFGIDPIISIESTAVNVTINSKLLYLFLDALGCGHAAHDKSVPDLMYNVEPRLVGDYLYGVFTGDGNVDSRVNTIKHDRYGEYESRASTIRLKLVSRLAVQKLVLLASVIDVQMNYYERMQKTAHPQTKEVYILPTFIASITSQDQIRKFERAVGYGASALHDNMRNTAGIFTRIPIKESGLEYSNLTYSSQYRSGGCVHVDPSLIDADGTQIAENLLEGDIHVLRVRRIEEIDYDDYVYDLVDVEDTHNFTNVLGIITGNCCAYNFSSNAETDDDFNDKLIFADGKHFSMGAWQVVSVNCPRAAYRADHDDQALFNELKHLMDIAVKLFKIKREWMKQIVENRRMPFATQHPKDPITGERGSQAVDLDGLVYEIGVIGINEMVQHHTGYQMHESKDAWKLAIRAMTEMELYSKELSEKHGMTIALARTPAETTAGRFAVSDILHHEYSEYAKAAVKGDLNGALARIHKTRDLPIYYTNGTHVPPGADISLAERIRIEHVFFPIVDGGNIMHIFLGESMPDPKGLRDFAMHIAKNTQTGYFAFTRDMTICMDCFHVAAGLKDDCPNCKSTNVEQLSRVTGYLQAVSGWNAAKRQELEDRNRYGGADMV